MSQQQKQRKKGGKDGKTKRRRQMILTPRVEVQDIGSEDSTLPVELSGDVAQVNLQDATQEVNVVGDITVRDMDNQDSDDSGSISDLNEEGLPKDTDPMRNDRPIYRGRWEDEEVDALMTALNVNRLAVKFHFDGPGGGKEVKRQGWRDVAAYVNDTADTHRTVYQCRQKADDYTQRVKAKYNKLRHTISRTGLGQIKDSLKIKETEAKALDYLKEEAVRGIPGIQVMSLPEDKKKKKPSAGNINLLWRPDREEKPNYELVKMKREGIPRNYREKNKRRVAREARKERKKENEKKQKAQRKHERKEAKENKKEKLKQKEFNNKRKMKDERRERKRDRAARRERKRQRAEARLAKEQSKRLLHLKNKKKPKN